MEGGPDRLPPVRTARPGRRGLPRRARRPGCTGVPAEQPRRGSARRARVV